MTELNNQTLPDAVLRVARVLQAHGHAHAPRMLDSAARTAQQAADALGIVVGQIAKSIIFRRKSDAAAVLVITSGDRRVDEKKLAQQVGAVGRADADFVRERTGYAIGGVPPLAHATPPVTLIDRDLLRFEEVWAAAGHPHAVFRLHPQDLCRMTGAPLADIAQETAQPVNAWRVIQQAQRVAAGEEAVATATPCNSVCRMNAAGLCEGCFRTLDEIAAWSVLDVDARRAVWRSLAQRAQAQLATGWGSMKHITFYLDFISPYAYLAFERLPQALQGHSYGVSYKPVLLAALLKHHGQLGPAEIPAKRAWTYRQIRWLAREHGVELQMPAAHPFNPMPLLRLALACGDGPTINRYVAETVFRHVWQGGTDAGDATRLAELTRDLQPRHAPDDTVVKAALRGNTEAAIVAGVFGVPSLEVDGRVFWGLDALPMLRAYLEGGAWFESPAWTDAAQWPVGVQRAPG